MIVDQNRRKKRFEKWTALYFLKDLMQFLSDIDLRIQWVNVLYID